MNQRNLRCHDGSSITSTLATAQVADWGRDYIRYVLDDGLKGRMADFQMQMGTH